MSKNKDLHNLLKSPEKAKRAWSNNFQDRFDSNEGDFQQGSQNHSALKLSHSKSVRNASEDALRPRPLQGYVLDHMTMMSNRVHGTIKNINDTMDAVHRPFLKFYQGNFLKDKQGIRKTLNDENHFVEGKKYLEKPGPGLDGCEKRLPYFPERDYYLKRKKLNEQRPESSGRLVGTKVLDLRIHSATKKTPKISEILNAEDSNILLTLQLSKYHALQGREQVKAEIDNLFSRKNSAPSIVSTAAESLIPSAMNTIRTSEGKAFPQNEQKFSKTASSFSKTTNSFNFAKRKELLDEVMSTKRNIEAMNSIYERPELQEDVVLNKGKIESLQKRRDISSRKPGDGVYYQILAMNKTQRARVRQKILSTIPNSLKYQHLYQD